MLPHRLIHMADPAQDVLEVSAAADATDMCAYAYAAYACIPALVDAHNLGHGMPSGHQPKVQLQSSLESCMQVHMGQEKQDQGHIIVPYKRTKQIALRTSKHQTCF